jgi:hypothetical protein
MLVPDTATSTYERTSKQEYLEIVNAYSLLIKLQVELMAPPKTAGIPPPG